MENIDDSLFNLAEKSQSDHERNMYFEALREIRIKRSLLQLGFDQAMEASFAQLTQNARSSVVDLDADELTLVELDDLEDNIAIDNMISKARPNFEDDLFAVVERLKVVLQRSEIDQDRNPFDPKAICDSFHTASDILETDIKVKLIFYKLFDKFVISNLGHFYREVNDFFIQKGVLPDFQASSERLKQSTKFLANRIKASRSQNNSTESNVSELPVLPVAEGGTPDTDGGLLAVLQQALSGSVGLSGQTGVPPVSNNNEQSSGIGILPVAQNTGYLSALTSLQTENLPSTSAQAIDPQNFKQAMHQQLLSFSQENQHQTSATDNQIIDIVSMLFDFFLDDDALPDPIKVLIGRLQIPILKAAIIDNNFFNQKKHPARLLLDSISKASLGWSQEGHQEKLLIDKIESIVHYILTEFEDNISIFDSALADFTVFLLDEAKYIQRADEAVIQQELDKDRQINDAQDAAAELIARVCKHCELSFEATDFLDTVWSSVLFHSCLSLGEDSDQWENLRRITSTLVWTLVPKFSEEERVRILKTLPALLRALSKGMELVKIGTDAQNRIYRMLAQEHAKVVKQTTKNIVTRADDQTIWPDEGNIADAFAKFDDKDGDVVDLISTEGSESEPSDTEVDLDSVNRITLTATKDVINELEDFTSAVDMGEIEVDEEIIMDSDEQVIFLSKPATDGDNFLEQAQALQIGNWVEFCEPITDSVNARLSWKSNVTGKLVFANRQGARVKSMSINAFAIELRSERARMVQSESVFDRAIDTMITTIKH